MSEPKKPAEDKKDENTSKNTGHTGGCGCGHSH